MSDCRWSAALFAAAFLSRLLTGLGAAIFGTDSGHYLLMADWMREGRFDDSLNVEYHPMFPLLIALMRTFTGTTEQAGMAVSMLLGAGAVVPLFGVVARTFGRPAAVLTGVLYAFSPAMVEVQSDVMTEGTFIFFMFSSMWLTDCMMEQPRPERAILLGLSAAAAYLTRPEGLLAVALAVAWPAAALVLRRDFVLSRGAGVALTAAVILLAATPYLVWIKSTRGHWALSVRQSVTSAEQAMGIDPPPKQTEEPVPPPSRFYAGFFRSVFRLTLYGVLVPFMLLGLRSLRRAGLRRCLFQFSWPLLHLAAILFTLRTHPFISERYLLAPMAVLWSLAGAGGVALLARLERQGTKPAWRPLAAVAVLAIAVFPACKGFQLRRMECRSYPVAAAHILGTGPKPRAMSGPVEQVAYLCGARSLYSEGTPEGIRHMVRERNVDCFVYTERDIDRRAAYIAMLRSSPELQAPEEITGPPGTLKVYVQRAR